MSPYPAIISRVARVAMMLSVLVLPLLLAPATYAQTGIRGTLDTVGEAGYGTTSDPDALPQVFGSVVQWALGLIGMILVVLCLYAGFMWMTAGGSEEKVTTAKGTLRNAVIGLALVLLSYAIAAFVIGALTDPTARDAGQSAGAAAVDAGCSIPGSQGCANQ